MPLRSRIETWRQALGQALPAKGPDTQSGLVASIAEAQQQWLSARSQFDFVCDPDLVDHVVFSMDAAEKRYMFLLREAREHGVTVLAPHEAVPCFRV